MCTYVTPAVPYLLLGLQDAQWAVRNSRGARKLARTPHVNQKKKKSLVTKIKMLSVGRTHMAPQVSKKQHFAASRLGKTSIVEHGSTVHPL
jgi:hypothetical protein